MIIMILSESTMCAVLYLNNIHNLSKIFRSDHNWQIVCWRFSISPESEKHNIFHHVDYDVPIIYRCVAFVNSVSNHCFYLQGVLWVSILVSDCQAVVWLLHVLGELPLSVWTILCFNAVVTGFLYRFHMFDNCEEFQMCLMLGRQLRELSSMCLDSKTNQFFS